MNDDSNRNPEPNAPHAGATPADTTRASGEAGSAPGGTTGNPEAPADATPGGASESRTFAPSQQELAVRVALEAVLDPEIGLSVIDLGLIREINIFPDRTHVRMMLTTPFCPYAPQMMADVKQATEAVVPVPCDVEIMPDAWSPQLMPDPGLLGYSF